MSALTEAKAALTICEAWHRLSLPGSPGKSCRSPFRHDKSPSFSVYEDGQRWKDHATGQGGDVSDFVAAALKISLSDAARWLLEQTGHHTARHNWPKVKTSVPAMPKAPAKQEPLRLPKIDRGTIAELSQLQQLRGLKLFAGLQILTNRGQLGFCTLQDGSESPRCWIIYDGTRNASARRLDGKPWQSLPNQPKAKTLKGSLAAWPLGASRIGKAYTVLFCEGTPDLLAAATFATFTLPEWEVVAMPGRMPIHREALKLFKGKTVFIFAHNDQPGLDAAREWQAQLTGVGAAVTALCSDTEGRDLNDVLNAGESISLT